MEGGCSNQNVSCKPLATHIISPTFSLCCYWFYYQQQRGESDWRVRAAVDGRAVPAAGVGDSVFISGEMASDG